MKFTYEQYLHDEQKIIGKMIRKINKLPVFKGNPNQLNEIFVKEPKIISNINEFYELIDLDIIYFQHIAENLIENLKSDNLPVISNYFFKFGYEKIEGVKGKMFMYSLWVKPREKNYGHIIFPAEVIKIDNDSFAYSGPIDVNLAMDTVKELLEIEEDEK